MFITQLKIISNLKILSCFQGDLAARNVLLTHDNIAKVADFGLCTRMYDDTTENKEARPGMFPFRWAAIEILLTEIPFKELSDVWSFGVLMWEVFCLGSALPYHELLGKKKIIEFLQNGQRLRKPELCPRFIYGVMMECWQERPTFLQLKSKLEHFLSLSQQSPREPRYSSTPHSERHLEHCSIQYTKESNHSSSTPHGSKSERHLQYCSMEFTKESNYSSNVT